MSAVARSVWVAPFLITLLLLAAGCDVGNHVDLQPQPENEVSAGAANTGQTTETQTPAPAAAQTSAPSAAPAAQPATTSAGFLWKPVSESTGDLVVLLPSSLRGQVQSAEIQRNGQRIEQGRFAGDTHNGMRPHYRFSLPGAAYGQNLTVVARLRNGSTRTYSVPNGGQRAGG